MRNEVEPAPGPGAQWSADGQWWWDGNQWTQMWEPPTGLAWDGQTWVRAAASTPPPPPLTQPAPVLQAAPPPAPEPPAPVLLAPAPPLPLRQPASTQPAPELRAVAPARPIGPAPNRRPRRRRPDPQGNGHSALPATPAVGPAPKVSAAGAVAQVPAPPAPAWHDPSPARPVTTTREDLLPPPPAPPVLARRGASRHRIVSRTTWLVAIATVLLMAGITTVILASTLARPSGDASGSQSQIRTGGPTSLQIAKALVGRQFTRDVVPPELADSAPFRDVYVPEAIPGLVGESSTTTSDFGGTVTFYVFADPVWAEAFFENPPTAFGCGVCSSMADAQPVQGVGEKATSYVLYRKVLGGQGWIATTTYVLSGSVVINGLYFPVNVANSSPSATDLAVATAYTRAALQLLKKVSA